MRSVHASFYRQWGAGSVRTFQFWKTGTNSELTEKKTGLKGYWGVYRVQGGTDQARGDLQKMNS